MLRELSSSPRHHYLDTKIGSNVLRSSLHLRRVVLSYLHLALKTLQFGYGTLNLLNSTQRQEEVTTFSMPSKHRWEIWAKEKKGGGRFP